MRPRCPQCHHSTHWRLRRGLWRCAACRYDWAPARLPLRLSAAQWRALLRWFVRGLSSAAIAEETGLHRQRVLRALTWIRQAMSRAVPPIFQGTVEVDETYLGGSWRNRRHRPPGRSVPPGRGTALKTAVFGILCRGGQVWAQVVSDVSRGTLQALIRRRVRRGTIICSDMWTGYTGIATKGYVHRLVDHSRGYTGRPRHHHINGLEGFWGYLKRRLAAKGGIRKERLPLYLAEYVWRYNHRQLTDVEKVRQLWRLLRSRS